MPAQIKHMFVLMMENRSFDHMLGFMKSAEYKIEGLDPEDRWNQDAAGNRIFAKPTARNSGDLLPDPHHHFDDVMEQVYGTRTPAAGQAPKMLGFVKNYGELPGCPALGANIMKCFDPASVPVLTTLAKEYAVCDQWYSSIPGPTLPNRLYAHCGTSKGRIEMAPEYWGQDFYSIYEELYKWNADSCIFYHDWTGVLTFKNLLKHQNLFFADFSKFAAVCAGEESDVPAYCFIEPRYNPKSGDVDVTHPANDQHPDNDVSAGELLIQNVYRAIRKNDELWKTSMLVIVYDEHGGLYDHVSPVPMVPPDNIPSDVPAFDFSSSGLRVPAVVISPYIRQGTISNVTFDHTTLIATAMTLFAPTHWPSDVFFARSKTANTLVGLLDLNMEPRMEYPDFDEAPVAPGTLERIQASAEGELSDLQRETVDHALHVNDSLPLKVRVKVPDKIETPINAHDFVQSVAAAAISAHPVNQ